jgi:hypothetical protein
LLLFHSLCLGFTRFALVLFALLSSHLLCFRSTRFAYTGTVSFREFVAGLATLAALRDKAEGSFYVRALSELKENILN